MHIEFQFNRKVHFLWDVYFERVLDEHMVADGRFPRRGVGALRAF